MKVEVRFREGALPLSSIGGKRVISFYNTEDALSMLFSSIPQFMSWDHALNSLMSALRYRTTSQKEDEALCVASVSDLDQSQIEAIVDGNTAEARMQKMYTLIGEVPASVLFNRSGKLRQEKGYFGWAPALLLGFSRGTIAHPVKVSRGEQGKHKVITHPKSDAFTRSIGSGGQACVGSRNRLFIPCMIDCSVRVVQE